GCSFILLIGSSDSGEISVRLVRLRRSYLLTTGQLIRKFTSPLYCLRRSACHVTATEVTVGDKIVILLDIPDVGSVVNGREVVELDIFNLVKSWLQKSSRPSCYLRLLLLRDMEVWDSARPRLGSYRAC
ncbi:hypothetical protein BKA83DRAFT_24639, partial [Pisolithus microcarpus]